MKTSKNTADGLQLTNGTGTTILNADPSTANVNLILPNTSGTLATVAQVVAATELPAIGDEGDVLTVASGVPAWAGTGIETLTTAPVAAVPTELYANPDEDNAGTWVFTVTYNGVVSAQFSLTGTAEVLTTQGFYDAIIALAPVGTEFHRIAATVYAGGYKDVDIKHIEPVGATKRHFTIQTISWSGAGDIVVAAAGDLGTNSVWNGLVKFGATTTHLWVRHTTPAVTAGVVWSNAYEAAKKLLFV